MLSLLFTPLVEPSGVPAWFGIFYSPAAAAAFVVALYVARPWGPFGRRMLD